MIQFNQLDVALFDNIAAVILLDSKDFIIILMRKESEYHSLHNYKEIEIFLKILFLIKDQKLIILFFGA
jgi:hypothetical protein